MSMSLARSRNFMAGSSVGVGSVQQSFDHGADHGEQEAESAKHDNAGDSQFALDVEFAVLFFAAHRSSSVGVGPVGRRPDVSKDTVVLL
jgi:hypothetical protein